MPRRPSFKLERSITHRLHTLSKLTDRVTNLAYRQEVGLALGEGRCLAAVGAFGPLSVNELAAYANVNKGQASRAAKMLVGQGWVKRAPAPADRRGVLLSLTSSGSKMWGRLGAVIARRNEEITGCLSPPELATLDDLLDRLVAHARTRSAGLEDEDKD